MIIVTGMDNTGKTTLCNTLSEKLNLPVIHSAGPELTSDEKKVWTLDQMTRELILPNRVIHDRFMPLEEMVYGPVLRGHSDFRMGDHFMDILSDIDPQIIYTRPDREIILADNGREQMEGVREKGEALLAAWDGLIFQMVSLGWKVFTYNWQNGPMTEAQIESLLEV